MSEYNKLTSSERRDVDAAIADCKRTGRMTEVGNAYAYPHPGGGVAWGYNDPETGFNTHRDVKR